MRGRNQEQRLGAGGEQLPAAVRTLKVRRGAIHQIEVRIRVALVQTEREHAEQVQKW